MNSRWSMFDIYSFMSSWSWFRCGFMGHCSWIIFWFCWCFVVISSMLGWSYICLLSCFSSLRMSYPVGLFLCLSNLSSCFFFQMINFFFSYFLSVFFFLNFLSFGQNFVSSCLVFCSILHILFQSLFGLIRPLLFVLLLSLFKISFFFCQSFFCVS
jgi:hypothetical protein